MGKSDFGASSIKFFNHFFKLPRHPWNEQMTGGDSYAEWQFKNGERTIAFYKDFASYSEMFSDKLVLDVGCGAGGKSMYFLTHNPKKVVGIDIVPGYKEESEQLASKLGLSGFEFRCENAKATKFDDCTFDTIIMNDAMEHFSEPDKVLKEMYRITKVGGRLYCNFAPYGHPYGAHLQDAIGIPWVQSFYSERSMIKAYCDLVQKYPDAERRINFRFSKDENGEYYFSYVNKISIKEFNKIINESEFENIYYREIPLRPFLSPLAHGLTKDHFVKMIVCVFEKK